LVIIGKGIIASITDNNMIQKSYADYITGLFDLLGAGNIHAAWLGVSRGVVVNGYDAQGI